MPAGSQDEPLRAARNQALYRAVNEKIKELNERFDEALSAGGNWICECFDPGCTKTMELTLGQYEELRTHPNRFAVLPGHVLEDVERVVEQHDSYHVVEKLGLGANYAEETAPARG